MLRDAEARGMSADDSKPFDLLKGLPPKEAAEIKASVAATTGPARQRPAGAKSAKGAKVGSKRG
jgi:hypothetical protein